MERGLEMTRGQISGGRRGTREAGSRRRRNWQPSQVSDKSGHLGRARRRGAWGLADGERAETGRRGSSP
jgi:hypothetical protein